MRSDGRSKFSSSTSDEPEEGKFYVKPNSSRSPSSDSEQMETSPQKNSIHGSSKRHGDENAQGFEPSTSKKKKKEGSGIDLEELLAQTYSKDMSTTRTAEEEFRRSRRREHRPAKSAEVAKKWSGNEEICVAQALLETASPAGEVNLNAFYQRAKEKIQGEISNSQLYDKMRNMSKRFRSIQAKLAEQGISEEMFAFRTPQEPELFKMWKQIWCRSSSHISENEEPNRILSETEGPNPRVIKSDNPGVAESEDGRTAGRESSEEEDLHLQDLQKPSPHQTVEENGRENICCRSEVVEKNLKNMLGNTESRLQALIHSSFNCLLGLGFGGGCACSGLSRRMKELIDAVNFVEEFPCFSDEQAKELQQKWRIHKIEELKMFSECLGLLHSQCKSFLQNLED